MRELQGTAVNFLANVRGGNEPGETTELEGGCEVVLIVADTAYQMRPDMQLTQGLRITTEKMFMGVDAMRRLSSDLAKWADEVDKVFPKSSIIKPQQSGLIIGG